MSNPNNQKGLSRRNFLKVGAIAGAGLQVAGMARAGFLAGRDKNNYLGWESFEGIAQDFNRKRFEFAGPAYKPVGPTRRPAKMTEYIFARNMIFGGKMKKGWRPNQGVEALGEPLASYYKKHPEELKLDIKRFTEVFPNAAKDHAKYGLYFALADAWAEGWAHIFTGYPQEPAEPPEISDYKVEQFTPAGLKVHPIRKPIPFKSPDHAAKLIKKIAHLYGATIVGIAELNPDYCYDVNLRGGPPGPFEVPKHWKYAIVVGVPHEWDQVLSNPAHGTSYDGYNRVRNCSARLTAFLKNLGYPARSHHPPAMYDLLVPPISVDAGIGQLGRHGFVIAPETGSNLRTAVVTTNAPMTVDKPIDFGVTEFCSKCKICAEQCPSGAISMADSSKGMVKRGYEHWYINSTKCFNFWMQAMGPLGCRLCLAVCPYSRKMNWTHRASKVMDVNDPTGLAKDALLWMQKAFVKAPDVQEYLRPPDGRFASYRPAPDWLEIENWFDVKVNNPQKGG